MVGNPIWYLWELAAAVRKCRPTRTARAPCHYSPCRNANPPRSSPQLVEWWDTNIGNDNRLWRGFATHYYNNYKKNNWLRYSGEPQACSSFLLSLLVHVFCQPISLSSWLVSIHFLYHFSMCLSVCLSIHVYAYLFLSSSLSLTIHLPVWPAIWSIIYPFYSCFYKCIHNQNISTARGSGRSFQKWETHRREVHGFGISFMTTNWKDWQAMSKTDWQTDKGTDSMNTKMIDWLTSWETHKVTK